MSLAKAILTQWANIYQWNLSNLGLQKYAGQPIPTLANGQRGEGSPAPNTQKGRIPSFPLVIEYRVQTTNQAGAMRGAIHGIYKSAAEAIMPVRSTSAFKEKGVRDVTGPL